MENWIGFIDWLKKILQEACFVMRNFKLVSLIFLPHNFFLYEQALIRVFHNIFWLQINFVYSQKRNTNSKGDFVPIQNPVE